MQGCHDDLGHFGFEWMLDLLRNKFYWPSMQDDAERHVWKCQRCLEIKSKLQCEKLNPILATYPLELVHLDYLIVKTLHTTKDLNVLSLPTTSPGMCKQ